MAQNFASKGVAIDATHGTTAYDFLLTTLMIIDEHGQGFPVAWCLSNHEDFIQMCIFFRYVKQNCGTLLPKVKSQDGKRIYDTIKQCESCTDASCSLRCKRCNICVHIFLCNCPDSLIRSTICKHVHLLQTALATKEIKENCDITDIPSTFDHCDADRKAYIKEVVKVLANNMPKQRERNEVSQVIQRLQGHFQQIDTDINSGCHSKDSLLQFEKQILAAKSLLDATNNKTPLHTLPVANIPGNKRIEPQPRFFSTKKKRKHTNHLRFTKPSDDDIKKIFGTKRPKNEFMPKVKVAGTQKGKVGQKKSGLSCI